MATSDADASFITLWFGWYSFKTEFRYVLGETTWLSALAPLRCWKVIGETP